MTELGDEARLSRRGLLTTAAGAAVGVAATRASAAMPASTGPRTGDRVIITNEDSCTLAVIDPVFDRVVTTVNLTSFDEDPRPPFRFVTGGMVTTHGAMLQKPLYHGAISVHGCAPSPDSRLIAVAGRGSSNLYLIEAGTLRIVGNTPNPLAGPSTNADAITSGIFVGREPHEPTFTPTGAELWVAVRGEDRVAVIDVDRARAESAGRLPRGSSIRGYLPMLPGPAMVWFADRGRTAVVISQKVPRMDVLQVGYDALGFSSVLSRRTLDIAERDSFGFSPFIKRSPDGRELWVSHKLADRLSVFEVADGRVRATDLIALGERARPNHIEFADNGGGSVVYATFARIDDDAPGGTTSSRIAIIDRSAPPGRRRVVSHFFSGGREAHGLWADPSGAKLYVAHELDDLPGALHAGQAVCTAFDISDPFRPRLVTRIPLGDLDLPSGKLRNKKSINLLYVRPGIPSATA